MKSINNNVTVVGEGMICPPYNCLWRSLCTICNKVKNMTKIGEKLTFGWIRKVDNHIINIMIKA